MNRCKILGMVHVAIPPEVDQVMIFQVGYVEDPFTFTYVHSKCTVCVAESVDNHTYFATFISSFFRQENFKTVLVTIFVCCENTFGLI